MRYQAEDQRQCGKLNNAVKPSGTGFWIKIRNQRKGNVDNM